MPSSYQIAPNLFLVRHPVSQKKVAPKIVEVPTNHFAIIDCSGSMSWDLPKIREQLKKKLPKLLKEKDTITIIWFSGRKQFGTLLEAEPVATLTDLQDVEKAIDRWLKPICLTGFKEPMEEATTVVERVLKKNPGSIASLFFMSDGCDNQWPRAEILKATEKAAGGFASTTFVEYGYYADRPLLTAMAEKAGGTLIFAEDFDRYAPTFEAAIQKKLSGAPRIEIKLDGTPIEGFAFALLDGDLLTFASENNVIHVPEDLREIAYLSPTAVGAPKDLTQLAKEFSDPNSEVSEGSQAISGAYAALSLYAIRMKPSVVFPLLKALGDVQFIDQFSTCFGKQAYSAFQEVAKNAAFSKSERWQKGWDPNKVPADDAFTILELMQLLASDDDNRVLLDHEEFKYNKIGRGRVDASDQLTAEEQKEIQALTTKLASEKKASKVKEINDKIAAITASKAPALEFKADPAPDGYPISSLTFNESRPNVSFLVRKSGTVDISSRLTKEMKLPVVFPTFIFRNYAVIKDGLVNIEKLPVRVTATTMRTLVREGVWDPGHPVDDARDLMGGDIVLDLRSLPVINRKMVKDVSAKTFFEAKYNLLLAQAEQKAYNSFSKELLPQKKSEGFVEQYGDEAAAWLKEQGFTDYSGFSPKSVQADAVDFYMGKELKVNLKGLSSLPSLNEVRKQIAKGKMTPAGNLMLPTVTLVEDFLKSPFYAKGADKDATLKVWLESQTKAAKAKTRDLIYQIAQMTFTIILGQIWPPEFASIDENTMLINAAPNKTLECSMEMREIEIKI